MTNTNINAQTTTSTIHSFSKQINWSCNALKFNKIFGSIAGETPVKFQKHRTTLNSYLATSRFQDSWWKGRLPLCEQWSREYRAAPLIVNSKPELCRAACNIDKYANSFCRILERLRYDQFYQYATGLTPLVPEGNPLRQCQSSYSAEYG